jgi:hypothetical protein
MLEQNYNDDKTKRRNIEIQKNNIIINNNVSNNITVHNKKLFYGDINQNIETIKPENIITLEQNITKNRSISRNLELKKNNIIINNNVSNNITVHKKE